MNNNILVMELNENADSPRSDQGHHCQNIRSVVPTIFTSNGVTKEGKRDPQASHIGKENRCSLNRLYRNPVGDVHMTTGDDLNSENDDFEIEPLSKTAKQQLKMNDIGISEASDDGNDLYHQLRMQKLSSRISKVESIHGTVEFKHQKDILQKYLKTLEALKPLDNIKESDSNSQCSLTQPLPASEFVKSTSVVGNLLFDTTDSQNAEEEENTKQRRKLKTPSSLWNLAGNDYRVNLNSGNIEVDNDSTSSSNIPSNDPGQLEHNSPISFKEKFASDSVLSSSSLLPLCSTAEMIPTNPSCIKAAVSQEVLQNTDECIVKNDISYGDVVIDNHSDGQHCHFEKKNAFESNDVCQCNKDEDNHLLTYQPLLMPSPNSPPPIPIYLVEEYHSGGEDGIKFLEGNKNEDEIMVKIEDKDKMIMEKGSHSNSLESMIDEETVVAAIGNNVGINQRQKLEDSSILILDNTPLKDNNPVIAVTSKNLTIQDSPVVGIIDRGDIVNFDLEHSTLNVSQLEELQFQRIQLEFHHDCIEKLKEFKQNILDNYEILKMDLIRKKYEYRERLGSLKNVFVLEEYDVPKTLLDFLRVEEFKLQNLDDQEQDNIKKVEKNESLCVVTSTIGSSARNPESMDHEKEENDSLTVAERLLTRRFDHVNNNNNNNRNNGQSSLVHACDQVKLLGINSEEALSDQPCYFSSANLQNQEKQPSNSLMPMNSVNSLSLTDHRDSCIVCPDFEKWEVDKLKVQLSKFGVKAGNKRYMVEKLKQLHIMSVRNGSSSGSSQQEKK